MASLSLTRSLAALSLAGALAVATGLAPGSPALAATSQHPGVWCAVAYPGAPAEIVVYARDQVVDGQALNAAPLTCSMLTGGTGWGFGNWVKGYPARVLISPTVRPGLLPQKGIRLPFAQTEHLIVDCHLQVAATTMWILGRSGDSRGQDVCAANGAA
jgi:hypothetical protein